MSDNNYKPIKPFRFWCQTVLPTVYDDSLSYYELLNKVVDYLNVMGENVETLHDEVVENTNTVNEYTEKFNELKAFVDEYFENLDVAQEINDKLDAMAESGELEVLITPTVRSVAPDVITDWMAEHITPTSPVVDKTLTVSSGAADALTAGTLIRNTICSVVDANRIVTGLTFEKGGFTPTGAPGAADNQIRINGVKLRRALRISLNSSEYKIHNVWTYLDASGGYAPNNHVYMVNALAGSYSTLTLNTILVPQLPGDNVVRFSISKVNGEAFGEDITEDTNAILAALSFSFPTDTALVQQSVPADAFTVGQRLGEMENDYLEVVGRIKNAIANVDRNKTYTITSGTGISTTGLFVADYRRARTNYIKAVKATKIKLSNPAYKIVSVWSYTGDILDVTTAVPYEQLLTKEQAVYWGDSVIINVPNEATMLAVSFSKANDSETMTTADESVIASAFSVCDYTDTSLSVENVPADAKAVGDALNGINLAPVAYNTMAADHNSYFGRWDNLVTEGYIASDREIEFVGSDNLTYQIKSYKIFGENWINTSVTYYGEYENNEDENEAQNLCNKPNVLVVSGFHGNEKQTPWALLEFVENICKHPKFAHLSGMYNWYFAPLLNPYGYDQNIRYCDSSNLDANRQFNEYLKAYLAGTSFTGNPVTKFAGEMALARNYCAIFDLHQNPNLIGGGYSTTSGTHYRDYLCGYSDIGGVDASTIKTILGVFNSLEVKFSQYYYKAPRQTFFLSTTNTPTADVTENGTFRMFCNDRLYVTVAGVSAHKLGRKLADNVLLLETSTRSYYYSGSTVSNNSTAMEITNEAVREFLLKVMSNADATPVVNYNVASNTNIVPCPVS